ncbi:MAG: IPTL-CTERM sorting domain-containing protein [Caulobacteraceae bacterium]|nr:IPTL-CTERM sorting domain-containing protein [Caulobacteraceae bacterium]
MNNAPSVNRYGTGTVALAPPPAPIPTLSEWAMILLGLMLAGGAALCIQRRQMMA